MPTHPLSHPELVDAILQHSLALLATANPDPRIVVLVFDASQGRVLDLRFESPEEVALLCKLHGLSPDPIPSPSNTEYPA